jgi:hypothetical protein
MAIMNRFTHDLETVELSDEECARYGRLVDDLCQGKEQRQLSVYLGAVTRSQVGGVCDLAGQVVQRMWREQARL